VSTPAKGAQGGATGGVEYSPAVAARRARRRRNQERAWANRSKGEVVCRPMTDDEKRRYFG